MARKKPAAVTDEDLRRLYLDDGLTMKQIGSLVGLSAPSVLLRLRRAGIPTRTRQTPYTKELVEPMVEAGRTVQEIALALGCSDTRVYQVLKDHGLKARDGRAQPKPWRRKERVRSGEYWLLYRPDHPLADKRGRVLEHRLVMEQTVGRYLLPEEVVHHMNHVKDDNRPENLMLLPDHRTHMKIHRPPGKPIGPGGNEARWGKRS